MDPRDIKGGIPWVSSLSGKTPIIARFIFPGWFYTGNNIVSNGISYKNGYVDDFALEMKDHYLYFERIGYFAYDAMYSKKYNMPCFICVISDK